MPMPATVKVSKRHQIALPAKARQILNIKSGDRLLVDIQDGLLLLLPEPQNYTRTLCGFHKEIWEDVNAQKYSDDERNSWTASQAD